MESAASGLIAGRAAANAVLGKCSEIPSNSTAIGALAAYVSNEGIVNFQPMNVNYGIMEGLTERIKDKRVKAERIAERSLAEIDGCAL